jgi:hypothetical protein
VAAKPPELKSVVYLLKRARFHPAGAMPAEYHQSYPIPVPGPKGLRVGLLYCPAAVVQPRQGMQLQTPVYLAFLDAETGQFEELKAVVPGEFGLKHAEGEVIGKYLSPPERLDAEFLGKQARLYQAYDQLLPGFAAGQPSVSPDVKKAAGEFKALFPQVTESALLPYYQAIGKAFLEWVNKVGS